MSQAVTAPFVRARAFSASRIDPVRALTRALLLALGCVLMAIGAVGAVLPGHLGLPVVVAGLAVVLRNSVWAKRAFIRLQRRRPNWVFPLRRLMRPRPEVLPVLWQSMLRTERLLLIGRRRLLVRIRHRLSGRRRRACDS
jgi:hypothetical protein